MSEISGPGPSSPAPAPSRPAPSPPPAPSAPAQATGSEPRDRATLTPPAQEKPPQATDAHVAGLNQSFSGRPPGSAQSPSLQERTQSALDSGNVEQQREIARELLEKQKRGERLSPEEVQAARQIQERPMTVEATLRGSQSRTENGRQITETRRMGLRSGDPHRPNGLVNEREVATERNYQGTPRIPFLPNAGVTRESRETTDLNTGRTRSEDVQRMEMGGRKRIGTDAELVAPRDGRRAHSTAGINFGLDVPLLGGIGAEARISSSDGLARRNAQRIAQGQVRQEVADRYRETRRLAGVEPADSR